MSRLNRFFSYFYLSRGEIRGLILLLGGVLLLLGLRIYCFYTPEWWQEEITAASTQDLLATLPPHLSNSTFIPSTEKENIDDTLLPSSNDTFVKGPLQKENTSPKNTRYAKLPLIEINRADSATWENLRGIGPVLSHRIIAYRKLLGGFVNLSQLKEVYGLRSGLVDTLASQLQVDTVLIERLSLNYATFKELLRHPYLEIEDVQRILTYRRIEKDSAEVYGLLTNGILDSQTFSRIRPYLSAP